MERGIARLVDNTINLAIAPLFDQEEMIGGQIIFRPFPA